MPVLKHHILAKNVQVPQACAVCPVMIIRDVSGALLCAQSRSEHLLQADSVTPPSHPHRDHCLHPAGGETET